MSAALFAEAVPIVIFRYGHGEVGMTGWGFFVILMAAALSSGGPRR